MNKSGQGGIADTLTNVHVANGLREYFGGGCRVADKNENNVFCTCDSVGDIKRRLLVMVV